MGSVYGKRKLRGGEKGNEEVEEGKQGRRGKTRKSIYHRQIQCRSRSRRKERSPKYLPLADRVIVIETSTIGLSIDQSTSVCTAGKR